MKIKEKINNSVVYQQIFDYFGYENQRRKLVEETQEVNDSILLYEKGEGDIKDVIEEIGDLLNVINGFIAAYDIEVSEISDSMTNKLTRTIYRINSGYYKKGN